MATLDDVRRIALALPDTAEGKGHDRVATWKVHGKLFVWEPDTFFTTPHFDGYPAVLVRLDAIGEAELEELAVEAWLDRAPQRLAKAFLAGQE